MYTVRILDCHVNTYYSEHLRVGGDLYRTYGPGGKMYISNERAVRWQLQGRCNGETGGGGVNRQCNKDLSRIDET